MSHFFESDEGLVQNRFQVRRRLPLTLAQDALLDARLRFGGQLRHAMRRAAGLPPCRVLIAGVEVPSRKQDIHRVVGRLAAGSRHTISVVVRPMEHGRGKFANIDAAIEDAPKALADYDWLVIADDDISFSRGFLDKFLGMSDLADLTISQPAHRLHSYASFSVTQRQSGSLVRTTNFVEIGPLTAIRREAFQKLIPFPPSRWCFGIDALWSESARANGWRMGVVDATPVRHLRPVANSYSMREAIEEGERFLSANPPQQTRREMLALGTVVIPG